MKEYICYFEEKNGYIASESVKFGGELIRCKDCKYWYAGGNINYCRKFWDDDGEPKLYRCTADDFCSRAERRTDGINRCGCTAE